MKQFRNYMLVLVIMAASVVTGYAHPYSYIYIQGDKQTPFYVKLNGKMLPRYGKNYCIIPELPAGSANIEILFQQHAFPAESFVIDVPANGSRGLLLTKQPQGFVLFDLQQKTYINPVVNTKQ